LTVIENELRKGNKQPLRDALKKREITMDQANRIVRLSSLPPIVAATLHLSAREMQLTYDNVDPAQQKQLLPYLRKKQMQERRKHPVLAK